MINHTKAQCARANVSYVSPTQFALDCIGQENPASESRNNDSSDPCWLCGGPTQGHGIDRKSAIPDTFASHNSARCQSSGIVCTSCAYFAVGKTWHDHVASSPSLDVKLWGTASWRNYGHFFSPGNHECPKPARWREILVSPPEGPFLACVSLTGQKNLIFRGVVALDSAFFPVQVEEETMWIDRADFVRCLEAFEAVMALGIGRDQVLTGRYHQSSIMKAGIAAWRRAEDAVSQWRMMKPNLLTLCHYCGQKGPGDERL